MVRLFPRTGSVHSHCGAIAGIFTGIIYLGIDKPPKIDGKQLTLDFELRVPASVKIPDEPNGYALRASLYANNQWPKPLWIH